MYAPPPAVVAPAPRRSGLTAGGPLLAICCLLFILFLIAATIVLALIPVYVERDIARVGNSRRYTARMTPVGRTLPEGRFTGNTARNFGTASDTALKLRSGAVQAQTDPQGVVAGGPVGKRKRRGFGLVRERRQGGTTGIGYMELVFVKNLFPSVSITRIMSERQPYLITIEVTIVTLDGETVTFSVTLSVEIFEELGFGSFVGSGSGSGITGRLAG